MSRHVILISFCSLRRKPHPLHNPRIPCRFLLLLATSRTRIRLIAALVAELVSLRYLDMAFLTAGGICGVRVFGGLAE